MQSSPLHYAFDPEEKIGPGFIRILGEISGRAKELSRARGNSLNDAAHNTRVLGKRLRALLWFGRPVLAASASRRAKSKIGKSSRLLAVERDRVVVQATLESLAARASAHDRRAAKKTAEMIAGSALSAKKMRRAVGQALRTLRQAVTVIKKSAASVHDWPNPPARVKKARRQMIKAAKAACRSGRNFDYHEWRKKTKRLLYEMELVDPGERTTIKRLDKLQHELGVHHDAVIVSERLLALKAHVDSSQRILDLLEKTKALRKKQASKIQRRI